MAISTTAKRPATVLDCAGKTLPHPYLFPELNGPRSTTDAQNSSKEAKNENYKAVVDLHVLRHDCTGGLEPNDEWPGQARHSGIFGSSNRCLSPPHRKNP